MSQLKVSFVLAVMVLGFPPLLADGQAPEASSQPAGASITLTDARQNALAASPVLMSLQAQVRAAEGAARQARALANPGLAFEAEDFGASSSLKVTTQRTLSVGQSLEWFGKRSARVAAADRGRDVVARDLARGRRDLLADVDRAFAALLGAQERAALAAQNAATAREVTQAVAALVEAGEASPVEAARAESDEALARIDLVNARRDADLARRSLARIWGEDSPSFPVASGELAATVELPDREASLAALSRLPDLTRWDAEAARQTSLATYAGRLALPDLELSVGTRTWSGLDGRAWVAGVTLPIPVLTQFVGARAEAGARQEQAALERRAEEVRVRADLLAAHDTLARALDEARAIREEVLPRAEKVYTALNEGYRRGKYRLLDLLEARRSLAQTRLRYVDALVRLATANADLGRLIPDPTNDDDGVDR